MFDIWWNFISPWNPLINLSLFKWISSWQLCTWIQSWNETCDCWIFRNDGTIFCLDVGDWKSCLFGFWIKQYHLDIRVCEVGYYKDPVLVICMLIQFHFFIWSCLWLSYCWFCGFSCLFRSCINSTLIFFFLIVLILRAWPWVNKVWSSKCCNSSNSTNEYLRVLIWHFVV